MVQVLALEDGEGGGLLCTAHLPLERPPPQEQDAPPPEQDILDAAIMDLRAPLDLTADPIKATENLEQTRIAPLGKAVDIENSRCRVNSTLHEYNIVQDFTPAGDGPSQPRQEPQRGRDIGVELDRAAPSAKSPPVLANPTYSSPYKNLRATHCIATELAILQGKELRKKLAHLQELLSTPKLQQKVIALAGEASGSRRDHSPPAVGPGKTQAKQALSPNHGRVNTAGATALWAKVVGTTTLSSLVTIAGSLATLLRS
jgi:hypothetical protein